MINAEVAKGNAKLAMGIVVRACYEVPGTPHKERINAQAALIPVEAMLLMLDDNSSKDDLRSIADEIDEAVSHVNGGNLEHLNRDYEYFIKNLKSSHRGLMNRLFG